jgi:hypothetical protein
MEFGYDFYTGLASPTHVKFETEEEEKYFNKSQLFNNLNNCDLPLFDYDIKYEIKSREGYKTSLVYKSPEQILSKLRRTAYKCPQYLKNLDDYEPTFEETTFRDDLFNIDVFNNLKIFEGKYMQPTQNYIRDEHFAAQFF